MTSVGSASGVLFLYLPFLLLPVPPASPTNSGSPVGMYSLPQFNSKMFKEARWEGPLIVPAAEQRQ